MSSCCLLAAMTKGTAISSNTRSTFAFGGYSMSSQSESAAISTLNSPHRLDVERVQETALVLGRVREQMPVGLGGRALAERSKRGHCPGRTQARESACETCYRPATLPQVRIDVIVLLRRTAAIRRRLLARAARAARTRSPSPRRGRGRFRIREPRPLPRGRRPALR
jgi:hypothetical protein